MSCLSAREQLQTIKDEAAAFRDEFQTLKKGDLEATARLLAKNQTIQERITSLCNILTPEFIRQTREESRAFYRTHNLSSFAEGLPERIHLSLGSRKRIREALEQGFDQAMFFVPHEEQTKNLDTLIQETAVQPVKDLSDEHQYDAEPYLFPRSEVLNAAIRNRPLRKPYLLLYSSHPISQETKNKTLSELDQLFLERGWDGLTLPEYLILQRKECEERKNHSFDAIDHKTAKENSNWTRLLDARVPDGALDASWDPWDQKVDLHGDMADFQHPGLGARPVMVVGI